MLSLPICRSNFKLTPAELYDQQGPEWTTSFEISPCHVLVQFYPWFKFYFLLFQNHYHTLPYPNIKEYKI